MEVIDVRIWSPTSRIEAVVKDGVAGTHYEVWDYDYSKKPKGEEASKVFRPSIKNRKMVFEPSPLGSHFTTHVREDGRRSYRVVDDGAGGTTWEKQET